MNNVRNAIKKGSAIRGPINLNDVVKAVTHMVHPDAAAHFCKVEISLAPSLPAIEGDPTQIQQVLINLVRNAFDAMHDTPPGRRIVEIATNYDRDGTIWVADALNKVKNEAARTAIVMEIFGKGGAKLLPLMSEGAEGINKLTARARELGIVFSAQDAEAATKSGVAVLNSG